MTDHNFIENLKSSSLNFFSKRLLYEADTTDYCKQIANFVCQDLLMRI